MYKPLTQEQYQAAKKAGFSSEQIIANEKIRKEKDVAPQRQNLNTPEIQQQIAEGKKASSFLGKSTADQVLNTNEFVKALPRGIAEVLFGGPVKFGASVSEIPGTVSSGGKSSGKTYNVPGLEPFQSYQSEAQKAVAGGENPAWTIAKKGTSATLAGLETLGLVKTAESVFKSALNFTKQKWNAKELDEVLDIVSSQTNKKSAISAYERSGQPGGVVKEGLLKTPKVAPTTHDADVADAAMGLVSKNSTPDENIIRLNARIEQIAEEAVEPALKSTPSPFNIKTLTARLNKIEPSISIKSDTTLNNMYQGLKDAMIKIAEKNPKTTYDLWKSRQEFDDLILKELGDSALDPTKLKAINRAALDIRSSVNDFIAEGAKNYGGIFEEAMKRMSLLYEARHNIATKNFDMLDKNIISQFLVNHPILKRLGFWVGGGAAGYAGYKMIK